MTKKKEIKKLKLNKWMKILLWISGLTLGIFLIFTIGFKIWMSTWQTYRNDEFGFSFKYPKKWYMGGTEITKKHFEEIGSVFFWVDKEKPEIVQGTTELRRSGGDVIISLGKKTESTKIFFDELSKSKFEKITSFGNQMGYVNEGVGGRTTTGDWISTKSLSINMSNYSFVSDTLTYAKTNPLSILIGLIQHKVGSTILDSFRFD